MPVEIVGNYPMLIRQRTGLFSLDMAVRRRGELGFPMRTITELYGRAESGKSTLGYYLTGKLTGNGNVFITDVDKFLDRNYLLTAYEKSGLNGQVHLIDSTDDKAKPRHHEDMLMEMAREFDSEDVGAVMIDSVGGIVPNVEKDEDEEFGQAFMGKRAKLVGQILNRFTITLRDKERPSIAMCINHVHSVIGGRGHTTPGGEKMTTKPAMRMMIWPQETLRDNDDELLGFLVKGVLEKHTFGGKGRTFTYYIVPEYGVHVGASAMFDCFTYELATRGAHVKIGDKSLGYLKADLLTYAREGKSIKFNPFIEELEKYEEKIMKEGIEDADDGTDTTEAG